ncbi:hypothetical protein [Streptosporangium carneum]|uniref:Uncharacterized protein n=1 Tax=Streptosporangium carneum TaxID=47481 RepID=A0A9W6I2F2_9ACTN|nr:hypothetical protein [Streptosporangium carneum]GLK10447.1 hypothetical protein GCM10017600_38530 [Streptosporangium carneum]
MPALQGVAAALAGTLAQLISPEVAMSVMAAASVTVTLALTRRTPEPVHTSEL